MPMTPNYAIPYPCEGVAVSTADFSAYALAVEAALALTDTEATAVLHVPNAVQQTTSNPAFAVETIMTFTTAVSSNVATGIVINAAAGTATIITPGFYKLGAAISSNQSTLTMTSQRAAIYINGVLWAVKKWRGFNPATQLSLSGNYDTMAQLAAGDVITCRYLWTGTGALSSPAFGNLYINMLSTP